MMKVGHGYRQRENRDILQQVMIMFFQRHLNDESPAQ